MDFREEAIKYLRNTLPWGAVADVGDNTLAELVKLLRDARDQGVRDSMIAMKCCADGHRAAARLAGIPHARRVGLTSSAADIEGAASTLAALLDTPTDASRSADRAPRTRGGVTLCTSCDGFGFIELGGGACKSLCGLCSGVGRLPERVA